VVLSTALLVLAAWIGVGAMLYLQWRDAIDTEINQDSNLAIVLNEQTARVLATADQATIRVRDAVAQGQLGSLDLARVAAETGLVPTALAQLGFIDAQGRLARSNLDPDGSKTGHPDLSDREHIRAHLAPGSLPEAERLGQPDQLFIGRPVLGKVSGKWTIQLSRRALDTQGKVAGVVVASLDTAYFEDLFKRVQIGKQGGVALIGADRGIRARVIGGQATDRGASVGPSGGFVKYVKGREGHFMGSSTIDGIERIMAYRQVADYPLYLLVSSGIDEALHDWFALRTTSLVLTTLLSLTLIAGAWSFVANLKRLENQHRALQQSEAAAQAANQAKSEFLAAMSHELRTPLTSIRGFAELMEHRLDQPRFRETAGLIRKGAEYLNDLLSQILDLAKVESGDMLLNEYPLDVQELITSVGDFYKLAAEAKGLVLHTHCGPEVPVRVLGDSLRIKQILNNLLSNAIKFTASGHVSLKVSLNGDQLIIAVRDTGPGIGVDAQAVIFERFRQADGRVSYEHGGTGLGLALSRALAELMGGSLTVQSAPGAGACFTLTVPCRPA
jgi:signal transduction histidine kinase